MYNWVGGVVGETYHKIQIVSCSSVKITLNGLEHKLTEYSKIF